MSSYEFQKEDAYRFANYVGIKAKAKGNNLIFDICPYCRNVSRDNKQKFAISLETGQFNCLRASCNVKGNMLRLSKDFGFDIGYTEAQKQEEYMVWKKFPKPEPTELVYHYLGKRGISEETCKKYHITKHAQKDNVIVFPFYDENDTLQCIKYRDTEYVKGSGGNKEWWQSAAVGKRNKMILFGMDNCDITEKTLVLTEGQIDSLSLAEIGIKNAVSVPTGANGFTWVQHCWMWLKNFDKLIVFGDNEKGHITLLDEMNKRFEGKVFRIPDRYYYGHKDANEILTSEGAEKLREAVEHAEQISIPAIQSLADIKHINLSDIEYCETGIRELDEKIGGLYFGQLVELTGKRGEGKSTFASQIGTLLMDQDIPTFFYSGELPNWYFKMWMDRQVAGPEYMSADCKIADKVVARINEFYRNHNACIFDNSIIGTDEYTGILDVLEMAIKKNGSRALFVDNLMTAIEDDGISDIYRMQSNFVKKLAEMAKRYNVIIFLICHPKKTLNADLDNDDVSGSSNITNLADVVLSYGRPPADKNGVVDNDCRLLRVLKNRLSGVLDLSGIRLRFEPNSKRIAGLGKTFDWKLIDDTDIMDAATEGDSDEELPFS